MGRLPRWLRGPTTPKCPVVASVEDLSRMRRRSALYSCEGTPTLLRDLPAARFNVVNRTYSGGPLIMKRILGGGRW